MHRVVINTFFQSLLITVALMTLLICVCVLHPALPSVLMSLHIHLNSFSTLHPTLLFWFFIIYLLSMICPRLFIYLLNFFFFNPLNTSKLFPYPASCYTRHFLHSLWNYLLSPLNSTIPRVHTTSYTLFLSIIFAILAFSIQGSVIYFLNPCHFFYLLCMGRHREKLCWI